MPIVASIPSKVLVVEGGSDERVVRHIRRWRHGQDRGEGILRFEIESTRGVGKLIDSMSAKIKASERTAIGFVLDANDDLEDRWHSIRDKLSKEMSEITLPETPRPDGTIIGTAPRVGFWLMPDNRNSGELEDFVVQMIPQGDPIWPLAKDYVACIPREHRKFASHKTGKAEIYAWLATRKNPGLVGKAIEQDDLTMDGPLCRKFVQWLEELFG